MFRLEMSTDNAAFMDGNLGSELKNILHKLSGDVWMALGNESVEHAEFPLFDVNGNRVGMAVYDRDA